MKEVLHHSPPDLMASEIYFLICFALHAVQIYIKNSRSVPVGYEHTVHVEVSTQGLSH